MKVPRERLDRPLLLAEGGHDEFCFPGTDQRLAAALTRAGSNVEFHHYPETGHLDVPNAALGDTLPFVARLFPTHT